MIHIHTYTGLVEIGQIYDRVTHKRRIFAKGLEKVIIRVKSASVISLDKFNKHNQKLGSFCLRDGDRTICVDPVLRYKPFE